MMASCGRCLNDIKIVVILVSIFYVTFFPFNSDGLMLLRDRDYDEKQMKVMLGSKPPKCVNKCMNCRPCMAALVASQHRMSKATSSRSPGQDDESYYLLTWKCRCSNKYFHP